MDKLLNLLGLAMRAGQVTSGEETVIKAIQNKKAKLVIIATDTSDGSKKTIQDKCKYYKIKNTVLASKDQLGRAIGKSPRSSISINDPGFANKILVLIEEKHGGD